MILERPPIPNGLGPHLNRVYGEIEQADVQNLKRTGDIDFPHELHARGGLVGSNGTSEALSLRLLGLAHALTSFIGTDVYGYDQVYASTGGRSVRGVAEFDAPNAILEFVSIGGAGATTKSSTTKGLIDMVAMGHDGADNLGNVNADVAIVSMRCRVGGANLTRWICDEDGDTWQSGDATVNNIIVSTTRSITASTTQTQGQQPLTSAANLVETVANANDVVTLPSAVDGLGCEVVNAGANTLQIFPASGDAIQGGAVDASVTLAAGNSVRFRAFDATDWYY